MKELIPAYLEAKESAWAVSTWKSEKARLNSLAGSLHLSPLGLYKKLEKQGMKPYSIKTAFMRVIDLEAFAGLEPKFREFLRTHKNRFKYAYQREEVIITFEEARARIAGLAEPYRSMATGLLTTGLRLSEAYAVKDGKVIGKGGKPRKIFGTIGKTAPKSTFARKLKAIGLKPHTLRKLCATRLAEKGASAADLCKVFGWSDIRIAYQYLQGKSDERLQKLFDGQDLEESKARL